MVFAWQCTSVYNPPYFHLYCCICIYSNRCWNCHCKFHQNFRSFLKNFLVCLKQRIFKSTISVNNYTTLSWFPLPKGGANIISLSSLSQSVFICHISLSVTSFQNFYHQFLLVMAKSYTSPNSISGWRDDELKLLYHTGISQPCLQNHIYELLASSTANLTGKIEVPC